MTQVEDFSYLLYRICRCQFPGGKLPIDKNMFLELLFYKFTDRNLLTEFAKFADGICKFAYKI